MIKKATIENYKSIVKQEFPLGRINVFIGENGCGKSNILEAIGMLCASKKYDLETEKLLNRGIRVVQPSLTFNSFLRKKQKEKINISIENEEGNSIASIFKCRDSQNIYASWEDELTPPLAEIFDSSTGSQSEVKEPGINYTKLLSNSFIGNKEIQDYLIYNISTNALREITTESKKMPLGIYGEGLDALLSTFNEQQFDELKSHNFISWLDNIIVDPSNSIRPHFKFGQTNSKLKLRFFDRYMGTPKQGFSAENVNEGALHVLFFLALFISDKTPAFFAIENIETGLNPQLCRNLMQTIAELSVRHNKQALITTHNPAILDGMNLFDENQKLFVVKRADDGQTLIEQLKAKPIIKESSYKLSELWTRGFIGGLPSNNF